MLDAVALERQSLPTITVVQDRFETAARLHARARGMPDLPMLIEPAPKGGNIGGDSDQVATANLDRVVAAFTEPV